MRGQRLFRYGLVFFLGYLGFCSLAATFLAEGALHPIKRALATADEMRAAEITHSQHSSLTDVAIAGEDGALLKAWDIQPSHKNGNAVILLHGVGDNRLGMLGFADLLLSHGYSVLLPDARAQGISGGQLATYGLLESEDIHRWFAWLQQREHPACIFGFGESMGAAQLLQSLQSEPHFCAVVAESSFSNFREIAYDRVGHAFHTGPWLGKTLLRPVIETAFGYVRWKCKMNFEQISPERVVAHTRVPVLLIHGQADSNIPVRHSRQIAADNPYLTLWEVPHADHCGASSTEPQEFEQRLLSWFGGGMCQKPAVISRSHCERL
jgi:uncharacterized protein